MWVTEFTVLPYFIELQKIPKSEANVPHVVHRWRAELLQYQFVIWQQLAKNSLERDMLSQYNRAKKLWRDNCAENELK